MVPSPEGARHAPATRRKRAAALAAHACAEDGDAFGPGGWKPAAGDPTAGERARHLPEHRAGGLRATARGRLHRRPRRLRRSEEHTSELQSLMRISYAVFCLKKKNIHKHCKHTA